MKITLEQNETTYSLCHPGHSISIALELLSEQANPSQPSHFGSSPSYRVAMKSGSFIGDVKQGGSCNAFILNLNVHCSGTHTESKWHFSESGKAPFEIINEPFMLGCLVSVTPSASIGDDTYSVAIENGDRIITRASLESAVSAVTRMNAFAGKVLIVRTLPNLVEKKLMRWGQDLESPFFTREAMEFAVSLGVKHLIVDFPSVDKSNDDGKLLCHRIFMADDTSTVTEMAFIKDDLVDGFYAVNYQLPPLKNDALPSLVTLYNLEKK